MSPKNPRVLVLTDQFWAPSGGTEQNILFLCNQLSNAGVEVCFKVLSFISEECVELFQVSFDPPIARQSIAPVRGLSKARQLAKLVADQKIDIVHAMCPISELTAVLATRFGTRARIMGSRRNIGYWHTFGTKWRARCVTRFVHHFIANCEAAKEAAVKLEWIHPNRITVIPNPIDLDRVQTGLQSPISKEALGLESTSKVVAMVANLRPVKDYETLFHAAQIVLANDSKVRFLVVGQGYGAYLESLQKLAIDLGIHEAVRWIDDVSNPFELLSLVDIGVLCSRSEGYSNALVEYAIAGIPTIATRVGGSPEIVVDGITGLLVEPSHPQRLAEKLLMLLANDDDRRRLGSHAQQIIHRNNAPQRIVRAYKHAYERILKE